MRYNEAKTKSSKEDFMMKWEYKSIKTETKLTISGTANRIEEICNFYGAEGWELVSFQSYNMSTRFILVFKRPVSE